MIASDNSIRSHYASQEGLYDRLLQVLLDSATSIFEIVPEMLSGVDEFHLGGKAATNSVGDSLNLRSDEVLLDVGCGIGGAARTLSVRFGCSVVGIDLTPEFVTTANKLSVLVRLHGQTRFLDGDANGLIYEDGHFDAATMFDVGMNIANKAVLMSEIARVLQPGGRIAILDVMRVDDGDLIYPMPWASDQADSFVSSPEEYEDALRSAGFSIMQSIDMSDVLLTAQKEAAASSNLLNLRHLMGRNFPEMQRNLLSAVKTGILAPIKIVASL